MIAPMNMADRKFDGRLRAFPSIAEGCAAVLTCAGWQAQAQSLHLQMQALMAEAQASAAKAAAEKEKEAAQRALKARNVPAMLRGAKLNIMGQAPVKGNALQEAAAKAPPAPSTTPKASNEGANGISRSGRFQQHVCRVPAGNWGLAYAKPARSARLPWTEVRNEAPCGCRAASEAC